MKSSRPDAARSEGVMVRQGSWFSAILRQACPACGKGQLFAGGNRTNQHCPVCGVQLIREQGWFLTAMYLSYPLGIVVLLALSLLVWRLLLPG